VRQGILNQTARSSMLTTAAMFELVVPHRARGRGAARAHAGACCAAARRTCSSRSKFNVVERRSKQDPLAGDGSSMLVPVPLLGAQRAPVR